MTDLEISKALALAIGWTDVHDHTGAVEVFYHSLNDLHYWREFDYRDWNVIGPIARHYQLTVDFGYPCAWRGSESIGTTGTTPQKAIALAVIGAKK